MYIQQETSNDDGNKVYTRQDELKKLSKDISEFVWVEEPLLEPVKKEKMKMSSRRLDFVKKFVWFEDELHNPTTTTAFPASSDDEFRRLSEVFEAKHPLVK